MSDDQTAIERIDLYDSPFRGPATRFPAIVPRRYWIENLFIVPIGRVGNASCFQTGNSGVNRIPSTGQYRWLRGDKRRASANDTIQRMQPHSVRMPIDVSNRCR